MTMNYLVPTARKVCPNCPRYKRDPNREAHEFRPAPGFSDGLNYICRACEQGLHDDFRLAQRSHIREKGLTFALAQVRRATTPATVVNLADGWMGMFGGVEGYLRESMAHYEAMAAARPGSPAVIGYLRDVARFVAIAQKHRPPERPEAELSDEDLIVEINTVVQELGLHEVESLPPPNVVENDAALGQPGDAVRSDGDRA